MINICNQVIKNKNLNIYIKKLKITKPGFYQLVGVNGSGKSTLLKYIFNTLETNTAAYTPQSHQLLSNMTVRDNLVFFCGNAIVNKDYEFLLVNLDYVVKDLSGGEKRKLQLYMSLTSSANILLIDEPFNHIDKESIELIKAKIESLSKCKIIIVIDHQNSKYSNNIIDVSDVIDYQTVSEMIEILPRKQKFSLKTMYQNLNIGSKVFLNLSYVVLVVSIFAFIENNSMNSFLNEFVNGYNTNNKCVGVTSESYAMTNSKLTNFEHAPHVKMKLVQRMPLSNKFVQYQSEAGLSVISMDQPKAIISQYDGVMPFYDFYKMIIGDFPEDNTNQVLLPEFYAQSLLNDGEQLDNIIGKTIKLNGYSVQVSGVYQGLEDVSGNAIIAAYDENEKPVENCDTALNGTEDYTHSNLNKLLNYIDFAVILNICLIVILKTLEREYFKTLKLLRIKNKLIYLYPLITVITILIGIVYYFNNP